MRKKKEFVKIDGQLFQVRPTNELVGDYISAYNRCLKGIYAAYSKPSRKKQEIFQFWENFRQRNCGYGDIFILSYNAQFFTLVWADTEARKIYKVTPTRQLVCDVFGSQAMYKEG